MKYKIPDADLLPLQAERILAYITSKTIEQGSVDAADVIATFKLPLPTLQAIRNSLIAAGKIEEV